MNTTDNGRAIRRDLDLQRALADLAARTRGADLRNHVMIVDDDELVAEGLREIIMDNCPGAAVVVMTNPDAAMRALHSGEWAVVVADISLGHAINGGKIAELAPRTTDVFLFTGHDVDTAESERALRLQGTIRKPVSEADERRLIECINARLERRSSLVPAA